MAAEKSNVILLHQGLGDVISALPMCRHIADNIKPEQALAIVVKSEVERELLQLFDWRVVPTIYVMGATKPTRYWRALRIAWQLRKARPDVLFAPHSTSSYLSYRLAALIDPSFSVGPQNERYSIGIEPAVNEHKVHYFLRFAEAKFGAVGEMPNLPSLLPRRDDYSANGRSLLGFDSGSARWVFIAPGSGDIERHKRWPVENFLRLIKEILNLSPEIRVGLFGCRSESILLSKLAYVPGYRARIKAISFSHLKNALSALTCASCIVSCCSGSAHLAALAGIPIVGIYGPTNPGFTGPFSDRFYLVRKPLPCSPCYREDFIRGCRNPVCMHSVSVQAVLDAVTSALEQKIPPPVPWLPTTQATKPLSDQGG